MTGKRIAGIRISLRRPFVALVLASLALTPIAYAQYGAPPPGSATAQVHAAFTQQELDQMLASIALYPDSLLTQILTAATYPLEVVEAARWSRANPDLKGDEAVRAVEHEDWDPSVKSLVAFPPLLATMDENLEWTRRLGEAFLAQEPHVMDTIQSLRRKAYAAGNLGSNDRIRVAPQGEIIEIAPSNPQVVYVPYYDPMIVYGPWWWPRYAPVHWTPWPGYHWRPGFVWGFAWGAGIPVSPRVFFCAFDWHRRHVKVVNVFVHRHAGAATATNIVNPPGVWQHNPFHRRGVPYHMASLRERFAGAGAGAVPRVRSENRATQPTISAPVLAPTGSTGAMPQMQTTPGSTVARPQMRSETRAIQPTMSAPAATQPGSTSPLPGTQRAVPSGSPAPLAPRTVQSDVRSSSVPAQTTPVVRQEARAPDNNRRDSRGPNVQRESESVGRFRMSLSHGDANRLSVPSVSVPVGRSNNAITATTPSIPSKSISPIANSRTDNATAATSPSVPIAPARPSVERRGSLSEGRGHSSFHAVAPPGHHATPATPPAAQAPASAQRSGGDGRGHGSSGKSHGGGGKHRERG